ncbi:Putative auto-transporter adhesin, head GIN domain [Mariniphaga anaerophila]|uniref:Putative auto-transporter adhesin, head GIN domain n=1 Tax=Mariniphaga anaerophila TaxID=1484053 RepID=A0A1M5A4Y6_9BACT|nr:head GIN domain-containing protein [Mariniphaga anaerophila]SHF25380.1 Putative auto-transporter adhesin, head GIN domain [Mariniphaga anaerophila]
MKTIQLIIAGLVFLSLATTSCVDDFFIDGNGIPASEVRVTTAFSSVSSDGDFDVHITPGNEYDVVVNAEESLMPYIETDVRGGNLKIHTRGLKSLRNQLPMEVFVTVPYIDKIVQSGSGSITTGYFEGDDFKIVVSGSGSVETSVDALTVEALVSGSGMVVVSGVARNAELALSGSGTIDAWELDLVNCEATISGSGDVWVYVERYLKAVISGSGNVYYGGFPAVEKHVSGSGSVVRKK